MDTGLKGKVALVAASSEGLGKASADRFAQEGAKLAICSRSADKLNKAKERLAITTQPRPAISAQETKKEKL